MCQSVLFSAGHPIDPRPLIVYPVGLRAIRTQAETKFCILAALPFPIQSIRPICPLPRLLSCGKWAPTVAGCHYAPRQDDVGSLLHFCFKFSMHQMFCLCPRDNRVISIGGKLLLHFKNSPFLYILFIWCHCSAALHKGLKDCRALGTVE